MRILIAEDDITSCNILKALLTKQGYEVVETVNGAQALQEMQKTDAPSLAILDWLMPEMDGPEVVRQIRKVPTDQPPYIIILTVKSEKMDIIAGLDAGADDYLAKPYDPGELYARECGPPHPDDASRDGREGTPTAKYTGTCQNAAGHHPDLRELQKDSGRQGLLESGGGLYSRP